MKTRSIQWMLREFLTIFLGQAVRFSFVLGFEVVFQHGDHQKANHSRGEAAVIQAHTAMQLGNSGDHAEMQECCHRTINPAILADDGGQTVGIANAHGDGLGIEILAECAAGDGGKKLEDF